MSYSITPELLMQLAVPGSGQQFETTVVNDNFTKIDSALADTGWITATLNAGWTVATVAPAYRRKNGFVSFRGRGTSDGTVAAAFALPADFRPAETRVNALMNGSGTMFRASIAAGGNVGLVTAAAVTALSFDDITTYPVG